MDRYNRARILSSVKALAVICGVEVEHLKVTHGAAAVLNAIVASTEDIDIQVADINTWDAIAAIKAPDFTADGARISFPGIEIHLESNLRIKPSYTLHSGVVVQSMESLMETYRSLIANPAGRNLEKQKQDMERFTTLEHKLSQKLQMERDMNCRHLKTMGPSIVSLLRAKQIVELAEDIGDAPIEVNFKDFDHTHYQVTLNNKVLKVASVDMLDCKIPLFTVEVDAIKQLY